MRRPKIIVADDYEDTLDLWRVNFKGAPFDYEFVAGGAELRERALAEDFDLVVTDLAMSPVDGWTAIEGIRRVKPGVPIWAVSAYLARDMMNRARGRELSVKLFEKPDGVVNLRELIERFFGL